MSKIKLTVDQIAALHDSCLDDSTKIIRYLEEQQYKQKKFNISMLLLAIISAVAAVIAAITGLLLFL
jgi:cytochrome b subunit of formate dehydrogenase